MYEKMSMKIGEFLKAKRRKYSWSEMVQDFYFSRCIKPLTLNFISMSLISLGS
uniref:Uncharacterized protein n=1 Tax=Cucumis melo TaxID=3656 RepID=A0A9I9EKD5_CUCME